MIVERINGKRVFDAALTKAVSQMTEYPISELRIPKEDLSAYLEREYPQYCTKDLLAKASKKTVAIA